MAVRTPLYYNSGNLQELTSTQITEIKTRMFNLFIDNPSVSLSYVGSGGNLGTISDTRLQAGAAATSISAFPDEATTAEPSIVNVNYDRISQTIATDSEPSNLNNVQYPLYYTVTGELRSMTLQDMYDTFSFDTVDNLISGGEVYTIATTDTISNYTAVSATPIFTDTRADTSQYTSGSIEETLDQPITIQNYYLHKRNATTTSYTVPAKITATGDIETPSSATFDTLLQNIIRYTAQSVTNYSIRFGYNLTNGNNCGTAMTDTRLNGSGDYQTLQVGGDDYRAQEFPNGSEITINTYNLTARKE